MNDLPRWAVEMRDLFRSGSAAQFHIHGNVFDVVPHGGRMLSVPAFLDEVMFPTYDVVLRYDRSRGVRATRGGEDWGGWLDQAAKLIDQTLAEDRREMQPGLDDAAHGVQVPGPSGGGGGVEHDQAADMPHGRRRLDHEELGIQRRELAHARH